MTEKQQLIRDVARLAKERNRCKQVAKHLFSLFRQDLDVENWLLHEPWLDPQAASKLPNTKIPPSHE